MVSAQVVYEAKKTVGIGDCLCEVAGPGARREVEAQHRGNKGEAA